MHQIKYEIPENFPVCVIPVLYWAPDFRSIDQIIAGQQYRLLFKPKKLFTCNAEKCYLYMHSDMMNRTKMSMWFEHVMDKKSASTEGFYQLNAIYMSMATYSPS